MDLSPDAIADLMRRNAQWFPQHGFDPPAFYAPPAWAMGPIPRSALRRLPFRYIETLTGIADMRRNRFIALPLVGYEADTPLRAIALRVFNAANRLAARASGRPLRIAIHPDDHRLALREDLQRLVHSPIRAIAVHDL
jgi:hypothetical protein